MFITKMPIEFATKSDFILLKSSLAFKRMVCSLQVRYNTNIFFFISPKSSLLK